MTLSNFFNGFRIVRNFNHQRLPSCAKQDAQCNTTESHKEAKNVVHSRPESKVEGSIWSELPTLCYQAKVSFGFQFQFLFCLQAICLRKDT